MSYNPKVTWGASNPPSPNCDHYRVDWTRNGVPVASATVPSFAVSGRFGDVNPTIVLVAGDVIGAQVTALDTVNNLASPPLIPTPATVTIPATPPGIPTNGALTVN